jgi:hypothetical protein
MIIDGDRIRLVVSTKSMRRDADGESIFPTDEAVGAAYVQQMRIDSR